MRNDTFILTVILASFVSIFTLFSPPRKAAAECAPMAGWTKATITRVIDGDTFDAVIDLGWRQSYATRIRLYGVNAPEVHGPEKSQGLAATKYVEEWLASCPGGAERFLLRSHGLGSFRRDLADVVCAATGADLATDELHTGHAVIYKR